MFIQAPSTQSSEELVDIRLTIFQLIAPPHAHLVNFMLSLKLVGRAFLSLKAEVLQVRAMPGGAIQLEYVNRMSTSSSELCVDGACMNMTNLHFHGLHVSPGAPGDDVLTMMAMPGESLPLHSGRSC